MKITLQELNSVANIIQLLQRDVKTNLDFGAVSAKENNSIQYLNFERVKIKLRRKKLISKKGENNNRIKFQLSQPIVAIFNKYTILVSLQ